MDGPEHDLWNMGLTLSIRQTTDIFPTASAEPRSTVALKEAIFSDLVGLNGAPLNLHDGKPPCYEIREVCHYNMSIVIVLMIVIVVGLDRGKCSRRRGSGAHWRQHHNARTRGITSSA